MYPLKLKPNVTDYLWGGNRLKTEYGYETENQIAAEAWVLSCHKDGAGIVANGEFCGKTLNEVLELWGEAAIEKKRHPFRIFRFLQSL